MSRGNPDRRRERSAAPSPWPPLAYQRWESLVFLNWPVRPEVVRPLLPDSVVPDLWDDRAWITLTPFTIGWVRPPLVPALPPIRWFTSSYEMNLRTYVRHGNRRGVWFLSLDATAPLAVLGGRTAFSLPYFLSRAELVTAPASEHGRYRFERIHPLAPPARLDVVWSPTGPPREAAPRSLEEFLVERYTTFLVRFGRLAIAEITHPRWQIRTAAVGKLEADVAERFGVDGNSDVQAYAQAEPFEAAIWPLRYVAS